MDPGSTEFHGYLWRLLQPNATRVPHEAFGFPRLVQLMPLWGASLLLQQHRWLAPTWGVWGGENRGSPVWASGWPGDFVDIMFVADVSDSRCVFVSSILEIYFAKSVDDTTLLEDDRLRFEKTTPWHPWQLENWDHVRFINLIDLMRVFLLTWNHRRCHFLSGLELMLGSAKTLQCKRLKHDATATMSHESSPNATISDQQMKLRLPVLIIDWCKIIGIRTYQLSPNETMNPA